MAAGGPRTWALGTAVLVAAVGVGVKRAAGQAADTAGASRARFWARPVASLIVPGSGQLLAREDRGALYLATEIYVLSQFLRLNQTGREEARRFRNLAFVAARRGFTPSIRDTTFEYFEQMEKFSASGRFSLGPGPALVPEDDPSTFNGAVWLLARRTFWDDPNVPPPTDSPQYLRALQFYVSRAIGPNFLWSWRDASLERQEFRRAIRRSDEAFRQAQSQLGLLLANHLVSAVDALISNRLSAVARRPAQLTTNLGLHEALVHVRIAF
jgi:hypothetical protein